MTRQLSASPADLETAAAFLSKGALVAFPTETVYGLGGDATSDRACAEIFAAKGRPQFNPLIVHVPDLATAERYAQLSEAAVALAQAFWPGPLTLVAPLAAGHGLSPLVSAGMETVALRVPAHDTAQALLRAFGGPIAAPSANPSGRISPTTAAHVLLGLEGRIAAVVDDGPTTVGLESTILAADGSLRLLREGGLSREEIEQVTGTRLEKAAPSDKVEAPGQLSSHYAPKHPVRLNRVKPDPNAVLIGFGAISGDLTLSETGDCVEAAARLFACLFDAQALATEKGVAEIHVAPIPHKGLGRAINDRLGRAAAPRPSGASESG